jgi:ABC-type amino acid transport system permease subunit
VFLGAAVAYLLLTLPSGLVVGVVERRVAIRR